MQQIPICRQACSVVFVDIVAAVVVSLDVWLATYMHVQQSEQ